MFTGQELYQHYKGGIDEVIVVACHSETLEEFVVYKSMYNEIECDRGSFWGRPTFMFFENVIVDGKVKSRFTLLKKKGDVSCYCREIDKKQSLVSNSFYPIQVPLF
ncbi:MAG: DUF1653 domain-containing protein [Candidatus Moraniibacteriota bacterium]|nr:MAG: DUF1653 domain-containing protein [Candidatus Moranbacteria bacterium]